MVSAYTRLEDSDVLYAKVEMHSAVTGKTFPIGELEITNVGGDDFYGDYDIKLKQQANAGSSVRYGTLGKFRRARGALALVREALHMLGH